jgi:hypothetical protein
VQEIHKRIVGFAGLKGQNPEKKQERSGKETGAGNERGIDFVIKIITRKESFGRSGSDNHFDNPEM